jgi:hypothetical protein
MRFASALIVSGVLYLMGQDSTEFAKPLTVCESLDHRNDLDGKMIAIRGVSVGTSEGVWLVDPKCPDPIATPRYAWPRSIYLASISHASSPVDFRFDSKADDKLRAEFERLHVNRKAVRIWITYVGRFETRKDLSTALFRDYNGGLHPAGFGQLNSVPAQLVVKTQRDMTIQAVDAP